MADYRIDTERAAFDVTTRPGVPGIGARVTGVQGSFRATVGDGGEVDLDHAVAGAFSLTVGDLRTGNQWVTARIPWLGSSDRALLRGWITHARRTRETDRDGRLELPMTIEVGDRTVKLVGSGRLVTRPAGDLEAVGGTLCDPRSFGIPLPPLVNLMVFVRWRLVLEPFPGGTDPGLDALLADAGR